MFDHQNFFNHFNTKLVCFPPSVHSKTEHSPSVHTSLLVLSPFVICCHKLNNRTIFCVYLIISERLANLKVIQDCLYSCWTVAHCEECMFKNRTIWQPDVFGPFKYQTCPVFRWLLYSNGPASGFQISFQIRTICLLDDFWPFKCRHVRSSDPHCIFKS